MKRVYYHFDILEYKMNLGYAGNPEWYREDLPHHKEIAKIMEETWNKSKKFSTLNGYAKLAKLKVIKVEGTTVGQIQIEDAKDGVEVEIEKLLYADFISLFLHKTIPGVDRQYHIYIGI